ncbi:hypothetical protein MRX96_050961 [Rhipicephalus microplus]
MCRHGKSAVTLVTRPHPWHTLDDGMGSTMLKALQSSSSEKPTKMYRCPEAVHARDRNRTQFDDHKKQQEGSNVAGDDTSFRSSKPRFKKRVASRFKSRSWFRGTSSAQKHTEHYVMPTETSPALKSTGPQLRKEVNEEINADRETPAVDWHLLHLWYGRSSEGQMADQMMEAQEA